MNLFKLRDFLKKKLVMDFSKYFVIGIIVTMMGIFLTWFLIDIFVINTIIARFSVLASLHFVKFFSYRITKLFSRKKLGHIQFIIYTVIVGFCYLLDIFLVWLLIDVLHIKTLISVTLVIGGLFLLRFILFKATRLIEKD